MSTKFVETHTHRIPITDKDESKKIETFIESINTDIAISITPKLIENTVVNSVVDAEASYKQSVGIPNRKLAPSYSRKDIYYSKTQKWIGHVLSIDGQTFEAKLEDLTNSGTYEIGEFEIEEISEEDKELLAIGATFYWSLGYSHENGQVSKKSIIRFQRVLTWDHDCLINATERAIRLSKNLKWE